MTDPTKAREEVVRVFNDSAAMPGNEDAFEDALSAFESAVRDEAEREGRLAEAELREYEAM